MFVSIFNQFVVWFDIRNFVFLLSIKLWINSNICFSMRRFLKLCSNRMWNTLSNFFDTFNNNALTIFEFFHVLCIFSIKMWTIIFDNKFLRFFMWRFNKSLCVFIAQINLLTKIESNVFFHNVQKCYQTICFWYIVIVFFKFS